MRDVSELPDLWADVLQDMRTLAERGTTVRTLVCLVQSRLGFGDDVLLPVLWYFMRAFQLHLKDVLPLREWLGTEQDEAIDALILPRLKTTKEQWMRKHGAANGAAAGPGGGPAPAEGRDADDDSTGNEPAGGH